MCCLSECVLNTWYSVQNTSTSLRYMEKLLLTLTIYNNEWYTNSQRSYRRRITPTPYSLDIYSDIFSERRKTTGKHRPGAVLVPVFYGFYKIIKPIKRIWMPKHAPLFKTIESFRSRVHWKYTQKHYSYQGIDRATKRWGGKRSTTQTTTTLMIT